MQELELKVSGEGKAYNAFVGFYVNSIVVNTDDHYHINFKAIIGDVPLMYVFSTTVACWYSAQLRSTSAICVQDGVGWLWT